MANTILRRIYRKFFGVPMRRYIRYSSLFSDLQSFFSYHPQELMLKNSMEFIRTAEVEGDYLEFGVYEGWTFIAAFHLAKHYSLNSMKFYAFDSFEGLPEITGVDAHGYRQYQVGEYTCDLSSFTKNLERHGVTLDRVITVPGWYKETLTDKTKQQLALYRAAIVWIDCDLYESSVHVLQFLTDYVQDGTVLIFDDWFAFRGDPDRGEQKAFREWLDNNPSIQAVDFGRMGWHGKAFVLLIRE
jgi:O-methyltransferase